LGGGAKQAAAAVGQVAGVFKPNAEASETRGHAYDRAALAQYTAEFAHPRRGWFDGLVDGLNRLVRPAITFGLLGILPAVVIWPEGAAIAFAALALLPAGYWALVTGDHRILFWRPHAAQSAGLPKICAISGK
jgi:hypothetical protein